MLSKAMLFPLGFFALALLNVAVPIIQNGPEAFQGGLPAAVFSFFPYLLLLAMSVHQMFEVRRKLPKESVPLREGGLLHVAPFRFLSLVGVMACFTYYGGLTTDIVLLAGVLIIVLHLAYIIHVRQRLMAG
ncbi:hypothetical protein [Halomonas sp. I5-271120]|uniref:hypothetical protein n=1 Tax=Halomonas sp. I5-271120 TaxID=3061632 RepID=UPI0027145E57|nr:hypothetical protein [Halomonas sp. I5-271120]